MKLSEFVKAEYGKSISECTNEELYYALLTLTKKMASGKQHGNSKKKLYYISAEFLIGKLLSNNLINLGIYDEVKEELAQNGKDICEIEEFENEPSLGNGGLGRLAACFIVSIATLGLNGDGVGLNYHFGLFRQIFENNMQTTVPDPWLTEKSWLTKTDVTYDINLPISLFGINFKMQCSSHIEVPVSDSPEFIRNVDMVIDYLERWKAYNDFKKNYDNMLGKVSSFFG